MFISDLNHLSTVDASVIGAGRKYRRRGGSVEVEFNVAKVKQNAFSKAIALSKKDDAYADAYSSNYSDIYQDN